MNNQLNLFGNENTKGLERRIYVSDLDSEKIVLVHLLKEDEPTPEEDAKTREDVDKIMLQRNDEIYLAEQRARELKPKYAAFLREVRARGVSMNSHNQVDTKKQMLEMYFPHQFAKQDLTRYTIAQIGRIFDKLVDYSQGQ